MPSPLKTSSLSLSDAINEHILKEKASFHTPGHKGFGWQTDGSFTIDSALQYDLTELPGLDELAYPSGVIHDLEKRAATVWNTHASLLSVNGATAGIIATILMLATRGTHLLVPRNCHRSVIHGLILSGLEPIWFDPHWETDWELWGSPDISQLTNLLHNIHTQTVSTSKQKAKIAGIIITSPTYAGAFADIESLSALTDKYEIPLVVDEAHGAHLLWTEQSKQSALFSNASIVIHSLHKTLSCPTQTGIVHISKKGKSEFGFTEYELRTCMNLIQSSSPSYLFMTAIDKLVEAFANNKAQAHLQMIEKLGNRLKAFIENSKDFTLYKSDKGNISTDILIKHKFLDAPTLQNLLMDKGIFSEAILGQGLLFFLGIGSQESDIDKLESALEQIMADHPSKSPSSAIKSISYQLANTKPTNQPKAIDQAVSPRKAFFMPSHIVSTKEAVGQISAECLAPCPPGWTILVPGQRITEEILEFKNIKSVRIIKTNGKFRSV